jgi:hypothetical protein
MWIRLGIHGGGGLRGEKKQIPCGNDKQKDKCEIVGIGLRFVDTKVLIDTLV